MERRILRVDPWQARVVGHALTGESASRQAELDHLTEEGYEVGTAGSSDSTASGRTHSRKTVSKSWPARQNPRTETEALQRQAEQAGIETLTHPERGQVACRILQYGWEPAWNWFEKQYGTEFKREVTWEQFRSIIEAYPEDYGHIDIPSKPR